MANVIRIGGGGGGQNLTLPPMVSNLAASTGDQSITLTWDNPDSDALAGVLIVYNDKHVPTKISDGTKVDAGLVETYELTGLTNETLYYIRVFPYNSKKQYQTILEGATITATPNDYPNEPTGYTKIEEITDSTTWKLPEDGYFLICALGKSGNGGRGLSIISAAGGSTICSLAAGGSGGTGSFAEKMVSGYKGDEYVFTITNSDTKVDYLGAAIINAKAGGNGTDGYRYGIGGTDVKNGSGGNGGTSSAIEGSAIQNGKPGNNGAYWSYSEHGSGSRDPGVVYGGAAVSSEYTSTIAPSETFITSSGAGGNGNANRSQEESYTNGGTGTSGKIIIYRGNTNQPSPSTVSALSLTPRNTSIEASWANSGDPESVGTILVSNSDHVPVHPTDGTSVDVAEATSYTVTDLPNNKPSYISLFAYNADKTKYSAARSDVEIPREVTWADTVEEAQQEAKEATDKAAVAEEQAKQANETLQAKTEELAQTSAELTEKQVMVDSATATFNALIASDIQNDTKVISDNMILDNADMLSKPWGARTPNEVGDIVWYMLGDVKQYYKVVQPTENVDPNHTPNIVPAVFVAINKTNAGTIDDPIPAVRGMEYEYGKYYLDNEDGKIYICKRGEETGTIVLQYLPHELIGHYFELATLTE